MVTHGSWRLPSEKRKVAHDNNVILWSKHSHQLFPRLTQLIIEVNWTGTKMVLPALEFSRICFFVVCCKNKERKIYFTLEQFRHLEQFLFWKKGLWLYWSFFVALWLVKKFRASCLAKHKKIWPYSTHSVPGKKKIAPPSQPIIRKIELKNSIAPLIKKTKQNKTKQARGLIEHRILITMSKKTRSSQMIKIVNFWNMSASVTLTGLVQYTL